MLSVIDDGTGRRGRRSPSSCRISTASTTPGGSAAAERLRDGLEALNIDYRSSLGEFPGAMLPIVTTHAIGGGPFAADAGRIKQRRIAGSGVEART